MDLTANYAQKKKISDVEDRWEGNTQIITWIKKDGKYTKDHTWWYIRYGKISSMQVFGILEWENLF